MRRARFEIIAAASVFALGGCALLAGHSGEDSRGRALKARGAQVVLALERYHAATGKLPDHLFELLPKYLPQIPDGLNTEYDPAANRFAFSYQADGDSGITTCEIAIGRRVWRGHGTM